MSAKYLLLAFIFFSLTCFSQKASTSTFYINHLPSDGILLDKGWKYHAGDNVEWAKPEYDDSNWQPINPTLKIQKLPQIFNHIGWFRLHLSIDNSILNKQLALVIQQSGASEIYLNGRLIHSIGKLSSNPEEIVAYNPLGKPVSFPVNSSGPQVLAVRYSLNPEINYKTTGGINRFVLHIQVNRIETSIDRYLNGIFSNTSHSFF